MLCGAILLSGATATCGSLIPKAEPTPTPPPPVIVDTVALTLAPAGVDVVFTNREASPVTVASFDYTVTGATPLTDKGLLATSCTSAVCNGPIPWPCFIHDGQASCFDPDQVGVVVGAGRSLVLGELTYQVDRPVQLTLSDVSVGMPGGDSVNVACPCVGVVIGPSLTPTPTPTKVGPPKTAIVGG